jgi:D-alanine-D-alanine ligase
MAASRKARVLLLFDVSDPVSEQEMPAHLRSPDRRTEADVAAALKENGFTVDYFGLSHDVKPLLEKLERDRPALVFNQCEAFANDRKFDPHVAALLELLHVPFTGARAHALTLCKDKALAKKVLAYHGFDVPRFLVAFRGERASALGPRLASLPYPALVKPLALEASEGITQASFARDAREALERIEFLFDSLQTDVIVEEYIEGREIYVSLMGNEKPVAFPPRELLFEEVPESEPRIATYRAKWNESYRKRWGIRGTSARGLSAGLGERLAETCQGIYRALGLKGYGRIDLRVTAEGRVYFIEANPNPAIGRREDFARSAQKAGLDYDTLIAKLVKLAA